MMPFSCYLTPLPLLAILMCTSLLTAQSPSSGEGAYPVSGTVTAAGGEALIGVTVMEKGNPRNGTITNVDGDFSLEVAAADATLLLSYTGFGSRQVAVNGRSRIDVTLEESASVLDQVVVVGYGTQLKRNLTGAVSTIEGDKLTGFNTPSLDQQLQGLATGVQVSTANGSPGAPTRILVRGTNSIFSGTEPLWIIDGMILSNQGGGELGGPGRNANSATPLNPIALINPNDIESVEVLKDAAATAVYGSRGANGVIIVTTKTGKKGQGGINVSASYGITEPTRDPRDLGFVDGPTWLTLADRARAFRDLSPYELSGDTGRDPNARLERSQYANTNTDWFDLIIRDGSFTDINVSTSRGADRINYYLSGNYRRDEGIITNDLMTRYGMRANVDFEPIDNLSIGTNLNFSYVDRERPPNGGSPGGNTNFASPGYNAIMNNIIPILPIFHPTATDSDGNPLLFDPLSGRNPVASLNRANFINDVETYRFIGGVDFEYRLPFVEGLAIRSELGMDYFNATTIEWANKVIREDSRYGFDASNSSRRYNYNLYATFNRTFGAHNFSVTGGTESTTQNRRYTNIEAQGLFGPTQEINTPGEITRASAGLGGEVYFRGYFGRMNYQYNERYLLGFSYRYDGSSIFNDEFRWGTFTALSAGWIISEENFLADNPVITFLKLRGSFGQTGNSAISPQATSTTYANWGRYGEVGAGDLLATIGNSDVTWETTDALDAGVDFEVLEGRVSGTVGYYRQDIRDMLFQVPIPVSSGIWSNSPIIWQNIGDMENQGWEFSLNSVNVNTPAFQWRSSFNLTTNRNLVTRLATPDSEISNGGGNGLVVREGSPLGFFRLARYAGVDPNVGYLLIEEMDQDLFNETGARVATGNIIPATRNNLRDNLFDNEDKTGLPTYFGGFSNTFTYRGFSLSALFSFSGGNYIYNNFARGGSFFTGEGTFLAENIDKVWTPQNTDAELPALNWNLRYDVVDDNGEIVDGGENTRFDNPGGGRVDDYWLEKGDYLRLRTLSIGYTLPTALTRKFGTKGISIVLAANNLLTFTNYSGLDPEIVEFGGSRNFSQGWAGTDLPQLRTFSFRINASF